jgi:hypothetical protein
MSDLARQKRLNVKLGGDGAQLTPTHTVEQAVELYLDEMQIRDRGLRWTAFSRGVLLDSKSELRNLDQTDTEWTVMPEVSAG